MAEVGRERSTKGSYLRLGNIKPLPPSDINVKPLLPSLKQNTVCTRALSLFLYGNTNEMKWDRHFSPTSRDGDGTTCGHRTFEICPCAVMPYSLAVYTDVSKQQPVSIFSIEVPRLSPEYE